MRHLALLHVVLRFPPLRSFWCQVVHFRDVSPHKFDGPAMSGLAIPVTPSGRDDSITVAWWLVSKTTFIQDECPVQAYDDTGYGRSSPDTEASSPDFYWFIAVVKMICICKAIGLRFDFNNRKPCLRHWSGNVAVTRPIVHVYASSRLRPLGAQTSIFPEPKTVKTWHETFGHICAK